MEEEVSLPDGFVGDNNLRPVLDLVGDSLKLGCHNLDCLSSLTLLQALAAAQNDTESAVKRCLGLVCDKLPISSAYRFSNHAIRTIAHLVILLEDYSPLRMAQDGPGNATILQLIGRDFASESAIGLVKDVLSGDFDALAEVFASEEEVEGWWCDDDLCKTGSVRHHFINAFRRKRHTSVRVELSIVDVVDNILNGLDIAIPLALLVHDMSCSGTHSLGRNIHLEVSTDEKLARHDCG